MAQPTARYKQIRLAIWAQSHPWLAHVLRICTAAVTTPTIKNPQSLTAHQATHLTDPTRLGSAAMHLNLFPHGLPGDEPWSYRRVSEKLVMKTGYLRVLPVPEDRPDDFTAGPDERTGRQVIWLSSDVFFRTL